MFPNEKHEELKKCLKDHGSINLAVAALVQANNSDDDLDTMASIMHVETPGSSSANPKNLKEELEELQKKFDIDKEKLKVDEDDLLNDAITYYKSAKFDPAKQLCVVY